MITTSTTLGWSVSTSMWRTVAVSTAGAVATASRFVISREALGRDAQRVVDLATHRAEVERAARRRRLVGHREQPVDEVALSGVRRHAPGGGVRVREQALRLELGQLGADRRGAPDEAGVGRERLRRHRLPGGGVALGDLAEDHLLAGRQHATDSTSLAGASGRWGEPRRNARPPVRGERSQTSSSAVAPRMIALALLRDGRGDVTREPVARARRAADRDLLLRDRGAAELHREPLRDARARRRPRSARARAAPSCRGRGGSGRAGRPSARTRRRGGSG